MNKTNLTEVQKQRLNVAQYVGIAGVVSMIITIACFALSSSKAEQLEKLKGTFYAFELEQSISTCNIVGGIFLVITIALAIFCAFAMYVIFFQKR